MKVHRKLVGLECQGVAVPPPESQLLRDGKEVGFTHDGDFPLNTSGGQLSVGQAGAAGGFLGLVEAIRQLTGEAGERAVKDARLGLVSGFGMVTYDRCLCTGAVILGRSS